MNILILSIDKSLVGEEVLGDVVERHKKYGEYVDSIDIIVYTNKKDKLGEFEISKKVKSYPTNSRAKIFFRKDALKIANEILKNKKIDVVVCQDPFYLGLAGVALKKKYKCKLQINFHGDFWDNSSWLKERFLNRIFLLISKFTVSRADAVRVMSEGQRQKLMKHGIDENKIRVISTPVNVNIKEVKREDNKKIILHVGRDDKVKDYETLVKMFEIVKKEMPEVELWQVGAQKQIKKFIKDEKGMVLKGKIPHEEVINLQCQVDVFVLTSTSESFGKVLVEANICARPVVSTATTGAKEIIEGGVNGFIAPIGNAGKLAEKVLYLLNNPDKAEEMGKKGQEMMKERFGDNTAKIVQLWRDLVDNNI